MLSTGKHWNTGKCSLFAKCCCLRCDRKENFLILLVSGIKEINKKLRLKTSAMSRSILHINTTQYVLWTHLHSIQEMGVLHHIQTCKLQIILSQKHDKENIWTITFTLLTDIYISEFSWKKMSLIFNVLKKAELEKDLKASVWRFGGIGLFYLLED